MSLMVILRTLEPEPEGLLFQCRDGDKIIECGIVVAALRDLISFHHIKKADDNLHRVLLPELERLVTAKYNAGRLEEDGWIVIRSADLLRYGFRARRKRAA